MNPIKKILDGLKSRVAKIQPGKPGVHVPKNRSKAFLVVGIVLVLGFAAGWFFWNSRSGKNAPVNKEQVPAKPISSPQALPAPVPAPTVVETPPPLAASQPLEGATQESTSKEPDQDKESVVASPKAEPENSTQTRVSNKQPATVTRHRHIKAPSLPAPEIKNSLSEEQVQPIPVPEGGVEKKTKPLSAQQQADNEFRKANDLAQQGRIEEALARYESALKFDPGHEAARQALVVVLLENKRNADAERVLQNGLNRNIKNSVFAMLLARIQVERDASWSALLTLQKTLPYAERQADYRAFVAALLQRLNHHQEAVAHYQAAVQLSPNSSVWWMGLGISLQALQRKEEARAAYKRSLDTGALNADLQTFVAQQMKAL